MQADIAQYCLFWRCKQRCTALALEATPTLLLECVGVDGRVAYAVEVRCWPTDEMICNSEIVGPFMNELVHLQMDSVQFTNCQNLPLN